MSIASIRSTNDLHFLCSLPARIVDAVAAAEPASTPANEDKSTKEEAKKSSADRASKTTPPVAENTALIFLKGIIDSPQKQTAAKVLNTQTNTTTTATATATTTTSSTTTTTTAS
jgi:hypothetical protein